MIGPGPTTLSPEEKALALLEERWRLLSALRTAERIQLKEFELPLESGVRAGADHFFEGCLPVEIIAGREEARLIYLAVRHAMDLGAAGTSGRGCSSGATFRLPSGRSG